MIWLSLPQQYQRLLRIRQDVQQHLWEEIWEVGLYLSEGSEDVFLLLSLVVQPIIVVIFSVLLFSKRLFPGLPTVAYGDTDFVKIFL
jgi:hypothetical protein